MQKLEKGWQIGKQCVITGLGGCLIDYIIGPERREQKVIWKSGE
jgi:tRNA A22 N-methylase